MFNKPIKKEEFELKKFRLEPGGGVYVEWLIKDSSNGKIIEDGLVLESKRLPHEKLTDAVHALSDPLKTIIQSEDWKEVEMIGITLKGTQENMVVVISGKKGIKNGQKMPFSPKVTINDSAFGVEDTVKKLVEEISLEVYGYLYEGKCLQPELPTAEDKGKE